MRVERNVRMIDRTGNRQKTVLALQGAGVCLLTLGLFSSGCRGRPGAAGGKGAQSHDPTVAVAAAPVQRRTMVRTLSVSGTLRTRDEVTVASEIPGRVVELTVDEGDRVHPGQLLVRLDETSLRAQLRQANAAVSVAEAKVAQAEAGKPLISTQVSTGIKQAQAALEAARAQLRQLQTGQTLTDTQVDTAVKQAESRLTAAKQNLQALRKGARDQERAEAHQAVVQAKANLTLAETNLERLQRLHAAGAAPQSALDDAVRQHDLARAQYESAKQRESLVGEGPRTEEIRVAEEQVRQAENALAQARQNRVQKQVTREQIEAARQRVQEAEAGLEAAKAAQARDTISREDVHAAEAGLEQAKANVAYLQDQLAKTRLTSSIAGVVAQRDVDRGEMVSPGAPLLHLVSLTSVYFEAVVSEVEVASITHGLPVEVTVDSLPGRTFHGRVSEVIPVADTASRTFRVKIRLPNPHRKLKPGSFARGKIRLETHEHALVVPRTAVVQRDSNEAVYVLQGDKVREQVVQVGLSDPSRAEILAGLRGDETVVVTGARNLRDGQRVRATTE